MKLNKTKKGFSAFAAGCLGVLGLLTIAMLCPVRQERASADVATEEASSAVTLAATTKVHSVVSIGMQSELDIELVPSGDITFGKNTANVVVSTNNRSGYSLYIRMAGEERALMNSDKTINEKIEPVSGSVTEANFATAANKDTWGYNLATGTTPGTTFKAVPASSATDATISVDNPSTKTTYTLTFGTAVSVDLPAGVYTNSVLVSAVANPLEVTSLAGLTYMQDMTTTICNNTEIGAKKTLIDVRDGKTYEVSKLMSSKNANGRCWMTQNLALDIDANYATKLNNTNTDVGANYAWPSFGASSVTSNTVPSAVSSPSQTTTYSWNFGKWVLATPTLGESCGDTQNIANCTHVGFVNVDNEDNWKPYGEVDGESFSAADGEWTMPSAQGATTTRTVNTYVAAKCTEMGSNGVCQKGVYDPHYLIGNYYQYNTATAGSGGTLTNSDAAWSLCPKGWGLPTSGDTEASPTAGSFMDLLKPYGLQSKVGGSTSQDNNSLGYNIAKAPVYFVRSGTVGLSAGRLWNSGVYGYDWSSRPSSNTANAYYLSLAASVKPSDSYGNRWSGFSLRCLAD